MDTFRASNAIAFIFCFCWQRSKKKIDENEQICMIKPFCFSIICIISRAFENKYLLLTKMKNRQNFHANANSKVNLHAVFHLFVGKQNTKITIKPNRPLVTKYFQSFLFRHYQMVQRAVQEFYTRDGQFYIYRNNPWHKEVRLVLLKYMIACGEVQVLPTQHHDA